VQRIWRRNPFFEIQETGGFDVWGGMGRVKPDEIRNRETPWGGSARPEALRWRSNTARFGARLALGSLSGWRPRGWANPQLRAWRADTNHKLTHSPSSRISARWSSAFTRLTPSLRKRFVVFPRVLLERFVETRAAPLGSLTPGGASPQSFMPRTFVRSLGQQGFRFRQRNIGFLRW
jgi:hypothetical protein